jgi:proline iminopeptidase
MRARVNGVDLFFDVHGSGLRADGERLVEKPVVIALHGGPGFDHSAFVPWLLPLAEAAQVICVDHRGNGRSSRPPVATCTLQAMADDIEALRQLLGLGRVVVLGVSFGGMLALTYALAHPANLAGLVLGVTAASHGFLDAARAAVRQRGTPEQVEAAETLLAGRIRDEAHFRHVMALLAPLYQHRTPPGPPVPDRSMVNLEMLNWFFSTAVHGYDVRQRLGEIKTPTLVLTGRHDWICPPSQSDELMAGVSGARQVMFDDSAHRPMREENDKFIAVMREFVSSVAGREAEGESGA